MNCLNKLASKELAPKKVLRKVQDHIDEKMEAENQAVIIKMIKFIRITVESHELHPEPELGEILYSKFVSSNSFEISCELFSAICSLIPTGTVEQYIIDDVIFNLTPLLENENFHAKSPLVGSLKTIVPYVQNVDESILSGIIEAWFDFPFISYI